MVVMAVAKALLALSAVPTAASPAATAAVACGAFEPAAGCVGSSHPRILLQNASHASSAVQCLAACEAQGVAGCCWHHPTVPGDDAGEDSCEWTTGGTILHTTGPTTREAAICHAPIPPSGPRLISWWFDVGDTAVVDAANLAAIRSHRSVFSRVMPCNVECKGCLNGTISAWWADSERVHAWNSPLQALGVPVFPYILDIDNATLMHSIYNKSEAWIADAVAIALHYGFQGWFIDYEDEHPADTDPHKTQKLVAFLDAFGGAMAVHNLSVTIAVAGWSKLLSDFKSIANSSVAGMQLMSTYTRPPNYSQILSQYYSGVKAGAGDLAVSLFYHNRAFNSGPGDPGKTLQPQKPCLLPPPLPPELTLILIALHYA